ncbi:MAG: hypothetical protein C0466_03625 [Candidatus Accumulibacter sp.]|nr:hypothetical protein [Accumulibacter sp.]
MSEAAEAVEPGEPARGRPKTRFAGRDEQVRQNMRLYRARRKAELEALGRTLERLLAAVGEGDVRQSFGAAAAVAGVWQDSLLRANLLSGRQAPARRSGAKLDAKGGAGDGRKRPTVDRPAAGAANPRATQVKSPDER